MIRPLSDFVLFRLILDSGLYVRGFGQAFKISPDMKNSKRVTGDSIADDMRSEHGRQVPGD